MARRCTAWHNNGAARFGTVVLSTVVLGTVVLGTVVLVEEEDEVGRGGLGLCWLAGWLAGAGLAAGLLAG